MKRIYCDEICEPKDEKTNQYFIKLDKAENEVKEELSDDDFKEYMIWSHNIVRKNLTLPNKLFVFAKNKCTNKVDILLFPKEPDGKCYKTNIDEETGCPYILVDDVE